MRAAVGALICLLSLESFALSYTAKLDLTSLYSKFDAGTYMVDVEVIPMDTTAIENVPLLREQTFHDGILECMTSANFPVGKMIITTSSLDKPHWKDQKTVQLNVTLSETVDGADCTTPASNFYGSIPTNLFLTAKDYTTLPVPAPGSYQKVNAWINPLALNMPLVMTTEPGYSHDTLNVLNPGDSLRRALENMNPQDLRLSYYVVASKRSQILSLGEGQVLLLKK